MTAHTPILQHTEARTLDGVRAMPDGPGLRPDGAEPAAQSQAEPLVPIADTVPARRFYEGELGGWTDGRLGQAYDIVFGVLKERGLDTHRNPLLAEIERTDEELAA